MYTVNGTTSRRNIDAENNNHVYQNLGNLSLEGGYFDRTYYLAASN
jgi:hypothetical protein